MKKVITFGVYDYFHIGHLKLFEQAIACGDSLTVAVQDGDVIKKYKPDTNIYYTTEERCKMVGALRIVDKVVIYSDVDEDIKKFDFDVFAIGEDQNHEGFQRAVEWCHENGKEVVRMHYTHGVSSTEIKKSKESRK